jgi:hypothetical protein
MKKILFSIMILLLIAGEIQAHIIGSVTRVKGLVQADRLGDEVNLILGSNIENKDIIRTENKSLLRAQMIDGGVVVIGENSVFVFKKYNFSDYYDNGQIGAHMSLRKGFFRIKTGQIGKLAPRHFRVDTKTAVIGIRGTNFYALVDKNHEEIGVLRGKIFVDTASRRFYLDSGERVVKKRRKWHKEKIPEKILLASKGGVLKLQRAVSGIGQCPRGKVWSQYLKKCILAPESDDFLEEPNLNECRNPSMVFDPETQKCVCPAGTTWSKVMRKCVTKAQRVEYCKRKYPGSIPALTEKECECPKSTWWSSKYHRCITPTEYCRREIRGSVPVFLESGEIDCECPKGYYLGRKTRKCYRYTPKPHKTSKPKPIKKPHHHVTRARTRPKPRPRPTSACRASRPLPAQHTYRRERPNYIVPALIGAAIVGGAIAIHHYNKKKHRKHRHRR